MLKQFPLQLGEAGAASCCDILNLNIISGGPDLNYECFVLDWFTFCMAAFIPRPSNTRAVISVTNSPTATKKSYAAVLTFDDLILKIHINHLGAILKLGNGFKHLQNLTDESLFS